MNKESANENACHTYTQKKYLFKEQEVRGRTYIYCPLNAFIFTYRLKVIINWYQFLEVIYHNLKV
jgi:hypothetical protein